MRKYDKTDIGRHADGAFGHVHVREKLAELLDDLRRATPDREVKRKCVELAAELHGEMSDDGSEEYDAVSILNDHAVDGVTFDFCDGDLMLWRDDDPHLTGKDT